jgi:hypothetical protein
MVSKKVKLPIFLAYLRKHGPLILVLIGITIAAGAYLQALNFPFISDDEVYITNNTKLLGLHPSGLWRLFREPYNSMEFLPFRDFSYWIDISLFGLDPAVFRIHNLFQYLACCLLIYAVTLSLWRTFRPAEAASAPWIAATVSALFAVNPAHVEAVVWISGRKDVLSGMFSMLALWLAVYARRESGLSPRYALATLFAVLAAMLSKATAVAVAPVIAILWLIFWRDIPASSRQRTLLLWPLSILLLAACIAVIFMAHSTIRPPAYWGIETATRALAVLGWMARLAVSPEGRHYFYPVFEDAWFLGMIALGVTALSAAIAGTAMLLRRKSLEGFSLVTFALLCLPYLQLLPFGTHSLVTDRFLFLAVWPVVLLMAGLAWRLKTIIRTVLLLVIAIPWIYQTATRTNDWRSLEALVDADMSAYPGHYLPASLKIFHVQGPSGSTREAMETANGITLPAIRNIMIKLIQIDHAVNIRGVSADNLRETIVQLLNLGVDLDQLPAQAQWNYPIEAPFTEAKNTLEREWMILAERFPDDLTLRYYAGLWLLGNGRFENAAVNLRAAVELQQLPESERGKALKHLGRALLRAGRVAEAEIPLRAALEQTQPDMGAYCVLSEVYRRTGRFAESTRAEAKCHDLVQNKVEDSKIR